MVRSGPRRVMVRSGSRRVLTIHCPMVRSDQRRVLSIAPAPCRACIARGSPLGGMKEESDGVVCNQGGLACGGMGRKNRTGVLIAHVTSDLGVTSYTRPSVALPVWPFFSLVGQNSSLSVRIL